LCSFYKLGSGQRGPRSPDLGSSPLCGTHAGNGALPDEVPFKLGDAAQDVEEEATCGRAGVDGLIQDNEINTKRLELPGEAGQVVDASGQSVQLLRRRQHRTCAGGHRP